MYKAFDKKTITDFSEKNINEMYSKGFLFTREEKGSMNQTVSVRIDLSKFSLSSENKRILKKTDSLEYKIDTLPLEEYDWKIHKLGKDFYEQKFGEKIFSANKIKELITDQEKSNFNTLLSFKEKDSVNHSGYVIAYSNGEIFHYTYPFYDHIHMQKDTGLGMMINAIIYAKENRFKFFYIGSATKKQDKYKFQFKGIEYFDGNNWSDNIEKIKNTLND